MSKKPLVSIIINCFNGEKYLREAINSVIAQSYENWEIIFWDNKSTDKSAKIFQSYNDKRLRYFLAPFHTELLYEARNYALEKTAGDFIAFSTITSLVFSIVFITSSLEICSQDIIKNKSKLIINFIT